MLPAGWRDAAGIPTKRELPTDPETAARWSLVAGEEPGPFAIVVRVTARDRNAEIERTAEDTLRVWVERAARLALDAAIVAPEEARDGRVLPGQSFQVRAWVRNHGEAAVTGTTPGASGTVRLVDLPPGYRVDTSDLDYALGPDGTTSVDWQVTAAPDYRPDVETMRIVFGVLPNDANSGIPAALLPDSSAARIVVSLAADGVHIDATPLVSAPAVPGAQRLPVLALTVENQAEAAVRLDSLGVLQSLSGVAAMRPILAAIRIVREDAPAETLVVRTAQAPVAWFAFPPGAGAIARLAPHTTARFVMLVDLAGDAPAGALELALRESATGGPLVRAVEAGSGTPLPVRTEPRASLTAAPTRIVDAGLRAFNAPNPFHVGRETTSIRYAVDAPTEVEIRIATLQGELVWESHGFEQVQGPELRSVVWDGRNGAGSEVRNGVYICNVRVGSQTTRFKIAVVR